MSPGGFLRILMLIPNVSGELGRDYIRVHEQLLFLQRISRVSKTIIELSHDRATGMPKTTMAYYLQTMQFARLPGMEDGRGAFGNRIRDSNLVF